MNLPDSLSHYEFLGRIGAGGMGEVYRARDTNLDRDVAIKILPPEMASDPELAHRFTREARTIASLDHPHIVTIHSGDYAGALEEFERVHRYRYMVGHYSAFFQRSDGRYLRGLCLAELGRHREAVGWFDAADEGVEFLGIYTAFGHLGQARSYEALGMREDAADHYRRFLRLMEGCDPGYVAEVEDAAGRLQRLEGVS